MLERSFGTKAKVREHKNGRDQNGGRRGKHPSKNRTRASKKRSMWYEQGLRHEAEVRVQREDGHRLLPPERA